MKQLKVVVFLLLVSVPVLMSSGCCTPPKIASLGVNLHPQERDWWCWAAAAEMISEHYGHRVNQCDSASYVHNKDHDPDVNCCTGCSGDCPCWGSAWGATIDEIKDNWSHWKFSYTYSDTTLSWDDLKKALSPTSYCWKTPIEVIISGHVLVAYGYAEIAGNKYVSYYDPWEPNCGINAGTCQSQPGGDDVVTTYDAFLTIWKKTFYNFKYTGT